MFDLQQVRKDFPILDRKVFGKPLVYLDSAATSQKPKQVIDSISRYYEEYNSNVHRGIHTLSEEASEVFENVREKARAFINAAETREIVFTRNATEALNLVALSWGENNLREGDEVLLSPLEHHSNLVPWQMLAQRKGAKLVFCSLTADGQIDMDSFKSCLGVATKLVAITHMSNALGTINPIEEIIRLSHAKGALVSVDGAQSVPHLPVDVRQMDCDFLSFSLHKMLGPTGVGILYAKARLLEDMPPVMGGGDMISSVWKDRVKFNQIPWKFEAGTPNIADVIASGTAFDYLAGIGMERVREHEIELVDYAIESLSILPGLSLYGPKSSATRGGVISFNLEGIHPHDVGQLLNEDAVAIRVGHHCCQPLMRDMDIAGTARASFYIYTTKQEIDILVKSILRAQKVFGHVACR